jgi:hypothetical protein
LESTSSEANVESHAPVAVSQINQGELAFVAHEPAPAPVVVAPAIMAAEPVVEEPKAPALEAPRPKPAPKLEPVNLAASGLVMIETTHDKVVAPMVEEAPRVPRGPRPKPAWAQQQASGASEPLQQVETRNDV